MSSQPPSPSSSAGTYSSRKSQSPSNPSTMSSPTSVKNKALPFVQPHGIGVNAAEGECLSRSYTDKDEAPVADGKHNQHLQSSPMRGTESYHEARVHKPATRIIMAKQNGVPNRYMIRLAYSSDLAAHLQWLERESKQLDGLGEVESGYDALKVYVAQLSGQVLDAVSRCPDVTLIQQTSKLELLLEDDVEVPGQVDLHSFI